MRPIDVPGRMYLYLSNTTTCIFAHFFSYRATAFPRPCIYLHFHSKLRYHKLERPLSAERENICPEPPSMRLLSLLLKRPDDITFTHIPPYRTYILHENTGNTNVQLGAIRTPSAVMGHAHAFQKWANNVVRAPEGKYVFQVDRVDM